MPLWYNSQLNLEYRRDWEQKGYLILNDILDDNGEIYTRNKMLDRNLNIHFLDYIKIKHAVKKLVKVNDDYVSIPGPTLPKILFEIGLNNKGCRRTYNKLMTYNGNIIQEVKEKWERTLNEEIDYTTIEKAFKTLPKINDSAYQKYLQFKLLHSRTAINEKLYTMEITDTNICPVCNVSIETIKHAFLECNSVVLLWKEIEKWFKINTRKTVKLSDIDKKIWKTNF